MDGAGKALANVRPSLPTHDPLNLRLAQTDRSCDTDVAIAIGMQAANLTDDVFGYLSLRMVFAARSAAAEHF